MITGKPEVADGFTKVANELLEAIIKQNIPGEQMKCLLYIMRMVYGYQGRKSCKLTLGNFVDSTGLSKPNVCRSLKALHSRKLIVIKDDNKQNKTYRINKYYRTWETLSRMITESTKNGSSVINADNGVALSKMIKNIIKDDNLAPLTPIIVKTKRKWELTSDEVRLSKKLYFLILERNPQHKEPNFQSWANHMDKIIRIDKRPIQMIEKVIEWSQQDSFWRNNILSTNKLRIHFDRLLLLMGEAKPEPRRPRLEEL